MGDEIEYGVELRMLWAPDMKYVDLTVGRHYTDGKYESQNIVFTPGDVEPGGDLRTLARDVMVMIAENL